MYGYLCRITSPVNHYYITLYVVHYKVIRVSSASKCCAIINLIVVSVVDDGDLRHNYTNLTIVTIIKKHISSKIHARHVLEHRILVWAKFHDLEV